MMVRRDALAVMLASALAGCLARPPPSRAESTAHPLIGKPIPAFHRASIDGREVDVGPRGVVIVKFFAKYCKPCERTLPDIEELHQARRDVLVVGVAVDESLEDVHALVHRHRLSFLVVHDRDNVLSGRYRVTDLPVTFVADRFGTIQWVGGGTASKDDVEAALERASTAIR